MKKFLLLTLLSLVTSFASATDIPERFKHSKPGQIYFGGKSQYLDLSTPNEGLATIGALLGITLWNDDHLGYVALDTYFTRTLNADELDLGAKDSNLAGFYLAYRKPTKLYGKAKLGGVSTELDNEGLSDDEGFYLSWGLGVGMEILFNADLEFEYERIKDDVDAWSISLILSE